MAATHWTQVLVLVSQAEVVPVQEALDVAVHCTHRPSDPQAGKAALLLWHCTSVEQPTQTLPTQKALVGSMQSALVPQVPEASGTRVSTAPSGTRWSIGASMIVPASEDEPPDASTGSPPLPPNPTVPPVPTVPPCCCPESMTGSQ